MYKQVTEDQLDVWMSDPVTKAYLEGLGYCLTDAKNVLAEGKFIDPANSHTTQYNAGYLSGRRNTLTEFADPKMVLARYEQQEVGDAERH